MRAVAPLLVTSSVGAGPRCLLWTVTSDFGGIRPGQATGVVRFASGPTGLGGVLESNQPQPRATVYGLGAAGRAELGVDRRDVELHGVLADLELARDQLVR